MSGFVDTAQSNVKGGDGGAGCVAFRRESHVPKGGPDGGDGGNGGAVWLRANRNVASLLAFRDHPHRKAGSGTHGKGQKLHGKRGADLTVDVPEGTVVRSMDGELLADLLHHGDTWLAARGGQGGRGNARFLSNAARAPSFAEQGEYGEERWLKLELKLLADAALVGFPNAGKSTLISVVSAAKPKIADYPFTTLEPHLGVVRWQDHDFVLADIPGLIEGAAEGRGLGHQFLRHIERARVLVILCDLNPIDGRSPAEQERVLLAELGRYRPELLDRPRLVVGSKADVALPDVEFDGLRIASVNRLGLDEFRGRLAELIEAARAAEGEAEPYVVFRPEEQGFSVVREGPKEWRVNGRPAERAVALGRPHEPRGDGVHPAEAPAHGRREGACPRGRHGRRHRAHRRSRARLRRAGLVTPVAVVKVGTSSVALQSGEFDDEALTKLAGDVAAARAGGHEIVLVMSGAIASGMPALGMRTRPTDIGTLQALAAVGQPRLQARMTSLLGDVGIIAGQVLLTPYDFAQRSQYLHARETLGRLRELGVLPIVNENDTVADDEIRFGDNDRLAALVAHMVRAETVVLLTDTDGVFTADPRYDEQASLIEEIIEVDEAMERVAGGAGTERGSGGMTSKLAAAKIASWSGVRAVIASASAPNVIADALGGPGRRDVVRGAAHAAAVAQTLDRVRTGLGRARHGRRGARRALVDGGKSLLAAGVRDVIGLFEVDAPVEIVGDDGRVFAKGLCRYAASQLRAVAGKRTSDLPSGSPQEVVHRDDLVVLP